MGSHSTKLALTPCMCPISMGVGSHALGPALHTMCWVGRGRQIVSPEERNKAIWQRIQTLYKQYNVPTRLNNLTLAMFVQESNPHASHPMLTCKEAETKHLLPIVAQISQESTTSSEEDRHRTHLLQSLSRFGDLLDTMPRFLDEAEAQRL